MKYQGVNLASFPAQINYALTHFDASALSPSISKTKTVYLCGLGGSGIAGRLVSNYLRSRSKLHIITVADYQLPATLEADALVICSSYSGNTEETLSMFDQALQKSCQMICISSGGTLSTLAQQHNIPLFLAESGYQPRMALGYSLTYLLLILHQINDEDIQSELASIGILLKDPKPFQDRASSIISDLTLSNTDRLQVLTDGPGESASLRFAQQLNENVKLPTHVHPIPEMCHNVIETITNDKADTSPWLFLESYTQPRNQKRFDFLAQLLTEKGRKFYRLKADCSDLKTLMDTVYMFDWLSLLLADKNGVNSSQIPNILALKAYLNDNAS